MPIFFNEMDGILRSNRPCAVPLLLHWLCQRCALLQSGVSFAVSDTLTVFVQFYILFLQCKEKFQKYVFLPSWL